ncbi:hypothetical protein NADE_004331 [Nannochloris sp. 'desiccata']|nr:hypothetical protein KSW81_007157 [Chlorella desiccata (nom. nud.)]KAH7621727.1 hypothetical protein NADE_004331 [Chlorella desiccata (nom. nud.)]
MTRAGFKLGPAAISLVLVGIAILLLVPLMRSSSAVPVASEQLSQESREFQYKQWKENFKAADPAYQAMCDQALQNYKGNGQFQQDMFVFYNVFKYWPMEGKKGFYVDSGTNDPIAGSNSLFYDKCLGWDGICVEPQEVWHQIIADARSCYLFKGCLASHSTSAVMQGDGQMAQAVFTNDTAAAAGSVQCATLKDILASQGHSSIDFWSLDVEGAEIDVLSSFDFEDVSVKSILIEDFWVIQRDLDYLLTSNGFLKYRQLAVDSFYLARTTPFLNPMWEPAGSQDDWVFNKNWRETLKDKIVC